MTSIHRLVGIGKRKRIFNLQEMIGWNYRNKAKRFCIYQKFKEGIDILFTVNKKYFVSFMD